MIYVKMDDFNISTLRQCTNELCSRLLNLITPFIVEGIQSIFQESWRICAENKEQSKYLMTFQNLLCRIPKWNSTIIHDETRRIMDKSGCEYLEDLVTCVHIIQLKTLTAIRVGNKQKKIDISIPKLDDFIHKVYIHIARKVYMNIYLFEKGITPLQTQKNMREFELIVHECILNAIRDSIPTEQIIRAYMDESVDIEEEVIIEDIIEPKPAVGAAPAAGGGASANLGAATAAAGDAPSSGAMERTIDDVPEKGTKFPVISNINDEPTVTKLSFNDIDSVLSEDNTHTQIEAPKDIERLEKISEASFLQRKLEEEESNQADGDDEKIKILADVDINELGIDSLDVKTDENIELDDIISI
jgi:hypothetical protein